MKVFAPMRSKAAAIATLAALASLAAGCGPSAEKRAVDARTEILHFFANDAPVVATLQTEPVTDVAALNRAGNSVPAWVSLRERVVAPLAAAGLTRADLTRLVMTREEIEGVQASALALGLPTPADLGNHQPLLVLATDQEDLLADRFKAGVAHHRLRAAGELHDADLYESRRYAYAVRDGVLVSAQSIGQVRAAILRRDGDSDLQLDEDVVGSLFNGLTAHGPLQVYANFGALREADPALQNLAQVAAWASILGPAAASVQPTPAGLHVEAYANSNGGDLVSAGLSIGSQPTSITLSASSIESRILPGPVTSLLTGLGPLTGQLTGGPDQVRVNLTSSG